MVLQLKPGRTGGLRLLGGGEIASPSPSDWRQMPGEREQGEGKRPPLEAETLWKPWMLLLLPWQCWLQGVEGRWTSSCHSAWLSSLLKALSPASLPPLPLLFPKGVGTTSPSLPPLWRTSQNPSRRTPDKPPIRALQPRALPEYAGSTRVSHSSRVRPPSEETPFFSFGFKST